MVATPIGRVSAEAKSERATPETEASTATAPKAIDIKTFIDNKSLSLTFSLRQQSHITIASTRPNPNVKKQ